MMTKPSRRTAEETASIGHRPTETAYEPGLQELLHRYQDAQHESKEATKKVRQDFLTQVAKSPSLLTKDEYSTFLADHIEPEDFAELNWKDPYHVVTFCETLYRFQSESDLEVTQINSHVSNLLRYALQQFEQQGKLEKMFQLLQLTPTSIEMSDTEVIRLRNRAHLYEVQRIQRARRLLYGYLFVQVVLIFLIFPFLFINAENGRIQRQIEAAVDQVADVELSQPGEERQFLTYADGLYWSIITAGSIGYGDITPKTVVGKIIAAFLGLIGVITVGVIAGLILKWITPRPLD